MLAPTTSAELADALRAAGSAGRSVALSGNSSKRCMAGPIATSDIDLTTRSLRGILQYEPRDLTISVGAGLPWREFTTLLAANRQMVPLDPPYGDQATVGGVVSANSSGPRRRLYGTARDVVIGMEFATLQGKVVRSGGMVVKNVAGLDMAKLLIGSFGTLAAIATVNFKLAPMPEVERSFLLAFPTLAAANEARSAILKGQLQPAAIDLLSPQAGATVGNPGWLLAIRVGGNQAAVDRYEHEFAGFADSVAIDDERQETLWRHVENFTPAFLQKHPDGTVVRVSCTLKEVEPVMASLPGAAVARAGSGVCYGYFESSAAAAEWMPLAVKSGWKAVMEFSPEERKHTLELWPSPGADVEIMKRVKKMFDPRNLLNRGRLYRRI